MHISFSGYFHIAFTALSLALGSASAYAQDSSGPQPKPEGQAQEIKPKSATESASAPIKPTSEPVTIAAIKALNLADGGLTNGAINLINEIVNQTRSDQSLIYLFAKTINKNIETHPNRPFVACVRQQTRKLSTTSYNDSLFQNKNLSNQLSTRLESVILESLQIIKVVEHPSTPVVSADDKSKCSDFDRSGQNTLNDFLAEMELLTTRFIESRRFRLGIGGAYLYLPRVSYPSVPNIDLSPFQVFSRFPTLSSNQPIALPDFSNRATPALALSATVPVGQADILFPSQSQSLSINSVVTRVATASNAASPDLLIRTKIDSTLKPEYDASISTTVTGVKILFKELRDLWSESRDSPDSAGEAKNSGRNWEIGFGFGTTGFRITENATTDVRLREDPAKSFNDLQTTGTIVSSKAITFRADYLKLDFRLQVSDELRVGFVSKYYRKATVDTGPVNIRGAAISMYTVWYPTFGW